MPAAKLDDAELILFDTAPNSHLSLGKQLTVSFEHEKETRVAFISNSGERVFQLVIDGKLEIGMLSGDTVSIYSPNVSDENKSTFIIKFHNCPDKASAFKKQLTDFNSSKLKLANSQGESDFDKRTETWSAVQYFQFYSYLSQQQNMMQDYIRTSTYQKAISCNSKIDFRDKVVLDVGAGSGILSFFAAQCGARRVYAVEASNMAGHCETLVRANKLAGKIVVISGKIEEITLPEPVDVIISEPMGYMLYNERMLETYVHARKFLDPKYRQPAADSPEGHSNKAILEPGIMYPTVAHMYVAPFSDEALFAEQQTKANFWYQPYFHGMDLSSLRESAIAEYFNQPIVDTFDINICPALPVKHSVDFRTIDEAEFHDIFIELDFHLHTCCTIHGLAFWFDVGFLGSVDSVWLSTSPTEPLTHWYQVRCLFKTPLFVQEDQRLKGSVHMRANLRQSYDVDIELIIPGTNSRITNTIDLKNPHFRYTGYPSAPPPGSHSKSPTDQYLANTYGTAAGGQADFQASQVVYPSSHFVTEATPNNCSDNSSVWNPAGLQPGMKDYISGLVGGSGTNQLGKEIPSKKV